MDTTQLVIIISIVSVSLVIVVCGIWLMFILKELRLTLKKTNGIIDDTKALTSSLSQPLSSLSDFVMGFKNGLHLFNSLFPKEKKDKF